MGLDIKKIKLENKSIINLIILNKSQNLALAFSKNKSFIKVDLNSGKSIFEKAIDLADIKLEKETQVHLSSDDKYIAVTNKFGQYGAIYETGDFNLVLKLDRGDYHDSVSIFPISFFIKNNKNYILHGSDWNRLDFTDLESGKLISSRKSIEYEDDDERYLDYFYGELHVSPNAKNLVSSGWVWQPVSVVKHTSIDRWFKEPYASETILGKDLVFWSGWDRALCWIDDEVLAYLYDSREEALSREELEERGLEKNKQYLILYNIIKGKEIKKIELSFPITENNEEDNCKLFFNKDAYLLSPNGYDIINIKNNTVTSNKLNFSLDQFSKSTNTVYSLNKGILTLIK